MRARIIKQVVVVTAIAILSICCADDTVADNASVSKANRARPIKLYRSRQADTDLEVTGLLAGLPSGETGYVHYADLFNLPHVTFEYRKDENFSGIKAEQHVVISGVYLEDVAKALEVLPASDLIDANCVDDYRAQYPASYIAAHRPVLALAIDRMSTAAWARRVQESSLGPYFIAYAHFIPDFKVLSYSDQPQVPANILRLNFTTTAATFGWITPPGKFAPDSPVQQGFTIAKQNCFRCHNQGQYGGRKSGRNWMVLSTWANEQPTYFANYVHNPKAFDPKAKMPGNPQYDTATLAAITAYFRIFADPVSSSASQ